MNYKKLIEEYGPVEGKRLWVEKTTAKRTKPTGFAKMSKKKASEIRSMGGKARWKNENNNSGQTTDTE